MKKITQTTILLLSMFTAIGQAKIENLKIVWPEQYKWKVGSNQEDKSIHFLELIPGNETVENWTIMGSMMSIKGAVNIPMDVAMKTMFDQAQANAPKAKLTFIEESEKEKNHWIIFKIEAPGFKTDNTPESQLYYIIQGESSLYTNFVALKQANLPIEFVAKWMKIFKESELVYQ